MICLGESEFFRFNYPIEEADESESSEESTIVSTVRVTPASKTIAASNELVTISTNGTN
jgi:hypothetical protein